MFKARLPNHATKSLRKWWHHDGPIPMRFKVQRHCQNAHRRNSKSMRKAIVVPLSRSKLSMQKLVSRTHISHQPACLPCLFRHRPIQCTSYRVQAQRKVILIITMRAQPEHQRKKSRKPTTQHLIPRRLRLRLPRSNRSSRAHQFSFLHVHPSQGFVDAHGDLAGRRCRVVGRSR